MTPRPARLTSRSWESWAGAAQNAFGLDLEVVVRLGGDSVLQFPPSSGVGGLTLISCSA